MKEEILKLLNEEGNLSGEIIDADIDDFASSIEEIGKKEDVSVYISYCLCDIY